MVGLLPSTMAIGIGKTRIAPPQVTPLGWVVNAVRTMAIIGMSTAANISARPT